MHLVTTFVANSARALTVLNTFKSRERKGTIMDPKVEKARLLNEIPIEESVLIKAQEVLSQTRRKIGLGPSVITSIVVGLCHFVWTRTIPTLAVKLAGDGNAMLMANPDFVIKIGADQAVFGLTHEAYHLLLVHLYVDPALMQNPNWVTATEACINHRINRHLQLPLITVDGKVAIVDPKSVYSRWKDAMKKANLPVVSEEDFYATDLGCFSYLESCPKDIPPYPRGSSNSENGCVHANDQQDGGTNPAPLDPSEVGKFMEKVLGSAVQAAKNGRKGAKDEVLTWVDASPEASKMWGDIGAGTLRGDTAHARKTDLWERWTAESIATRLADGTRWKYNKKLPWDPRVSASGREPRKHGSVFVDASGSMSQAFLDKVASIISDIDNIEIEWHSFDGEDWPFKSGENFKGGGGTSFQVIDDHLQGDGSNYENDDMHSDGDQDDDFVLVITDGYAPQILPKEHDKWLWLITPGGDCWPQNAGMSCREVDIDNE